MLRRPLPRPRSTSGGLAARTYLGFFPACPARRRPPVPRPDFAIAGGPAAGAPPPASQNRSLRWVSPAGRGARDRGTGGPPPPVPSELGASGAGGAGEEGEGSPAPGSGRVGALRSGASEPRVARAGRVEVPPVSGSGARVLGGRTGGSRRALLGPFYLVELDREKQKNSS